MDLIIKKICKIPLWYYKKCVLGLRITSYYNPKLCNKKWILLNNALETSPNHKITKKIFKLIILIIIRNRITSTPKKEFIITI